MNLSKPIGGYFELELPKGSQFHKNVVQLQSARSCIDYLIHTLNIKKLYIPKYTCDVVLQPIQRNDIKYEFYSINNNLEIKTDINTEDGEYIIYTNYFGLKDAYCDHLGKAYGSKLILDCSQAYFYNNYSKSHIIYSPRKFFGVSDGGELYTKSSLDMDLDIDISYERYSHLLKRIDLDPELGYEDFKLNDKKLDNQPIKHISNLTKRILSSIDYDNAMKIRRENYNYIHRALRDSNDLGFSLGNNEVPMSYPYLVKNTGLKEYLINNFIYIPTYWPNVYEWASTSEYEYYLAENLIAIPIDQRYNTKDMKQILDIINEYNTIL